MMSIVNRNRLFVLSLITCFISCSQVGSDNQVVKIVAVQYNGVHSFSEGMSRVKKGGEYGFVDASGKEIIPCRYDAAVDFSDGLAWVSRAGFSGFINKTGEEVLPCDYKVVSLIGYTPGFSNGRALVEFEGKKGFIDKSGNLVTQFVYSLARPFADGFAWVTKDGRNWEFIDTTGRCCGRAPGLYDVHPYDFREGVAKIESTYDGKWYYKFIDKTEKKVVPASGGHWTGIGTSDRLGDYCSEGRIYYASRAGDGFFNKEGYEIIPAQYAEAHNFSEGLAGVKSYSNLKWGFVNDFGEEIIPFQYDYADSFSEGLALVERDGRYGFINRTGEEVIPCKYKCPNLPGKFSNGLAFVQNERYKYGFIDTTGNVVVPFEYDEITDFHDGAAWLCKKDKWMLAIVNTQ